MRNGFLVASSLPSHSTLHLEETHRHSVSLVIVDAVAGASTVFPNCCTEGSPILQDMGCLASQNLQNHRMVGIEKDPWGSPSPTPCRSRVTQSSLLRTASRWDLNTSREGDSPAPLGSLCQGSATLRVKKFFLVFSWNFLCSSLCPLPLVLSLAERELQKNKTFILGRQDRMQKVQVYIE